jgi:putative aldouronate transport system permease protein
MEDKGKTMIMSQVKRVRFIRRSTGEAVFDSFNIIAMVVLIAVMTLPMIHVLNVSLSSGRESMQSGFFFLPRGALTLNGYAIVFRDKLIVTSYLNSIFYATGSILITLFFTALTAYPLSIRNFVLKKPATIFLTITMFFNGGLIPTYMLIRSLGMVDTFWVMILPFCVGAYNVILFRTFFTSTHESLREAAMIDGASEWTTLFRIYLPLSKPIFATIGLFTLVGKWNDWFSAMIYLNSEIKYPVQLVLRKVLFNSQAMQKMDALTISMLSQMKVSGQNIKMAAIIITILPILCVYPFLQKYFVKGVFIGTIKG